MGMSCQARYYCTIQDAVQHRTNDQFSPFVMYAVPPSIIKASHLGMKLPGHSSLSFRLSMIELCGIISKRIFFFPCFKIEVCSIFSNKVLLSSSWGVNKRNVNSLVFGGYGLSLANNSRKSSLFLPPCFFTCHPLLPCMGIAALLQNNSILTLLLTCIHIFQESSTAICFYMTGIRSYQSFYLCFSLLPCPPNQQQIIPSHSITYF